MLIRARDTFSIDTPLVGVYSTRGWAHPGPFPFWQISLYQLGGLIGGNAVFAITALANGIILSFGVWLAKTAIDFKTSVITCLFSLGIFSGMGGENIGDFWNPYLAVPWLFLFMISMLCLILGDKPPLKLLLISSVLSGTAAIQNHVGFTGPILLIGLLTLAVLFTSKKKSVLSDLIPGIFLGVTLWALPVIDLFAGQRNLKALLDFFRENRSLENSLWDGAGIVGGIIAPLGSWVTGNYRYGLAGVVSDGQFWMLMTLITIVIATVVTPKRQLKTASAVSLPLALITPFLAQRVDGFLFEYLFTWVIAIGAFTWMVIAIQTINPLTRLWQEKSKIKLYIPTVTIMSVLTLTTALSVLGEVRLPSQRFVQTTQPVAQDLANYIERQGFKNKARIEYEFDAIGVAGPSVMADLILTHDIEFKTSDGLSGYKWGEKRAATDPLDENTIWIVIKYSNPNFTKAGQCLIDNGKTISFHQNLDEDDSAELFDLQLAQLGKSLEKKQQDRLKELSREALTMVAVTNVNKIC